MNQISLDLKAKKSGTLSQYLKDLVLAGFLEKFKHYSFQTAQVKMHSYRIKDNYLRFYLKYIEPYKEQIENNQFEFEKIKRLAHWEQMMGLLFENTILNNKPLIYSQLNINPSEVIWAGTYIQRKNSKNLGGCQIDLLIHTKDQSVFVCEIKMQKSIGTEVIQELKRKIKVLKRPRYISIKKVLITEGEVKSSLKSTEFFDYIIHAADLLNANYNSY